jgi:hypothetical protein
MSDEQTCGKGLAEHAALPATMGRLASAMAEVLAMHIPSLGSDAGSQPEREAYTTLVDDYRALAATLHDIANRMAGYRNLPMASHDVAQLGSEQAMASFESFVEAERVLLALLQSSVAHP